MMHTTVSFESIASHLNAAIDEFFPASDCARAVRIIGEPGRFMCTSSHTLVTVIHGKRTIAEQLPVDRSNCGELTTNCKQLYYMDDGAYHSFSCVFFGDPPPPPRLMRAPMRGSGSIYIRNTVRSLTDVRWCVCVCVFTDHEPFGSTLMPSKLYGPTLCGLDMILDDLLLPDMEIGDWFVWPNMGSYTRPVSTQFNDIVKDTQFYVCTDGL